MITAESTDSGAAGNAAGTAVVLRLSMHGRVQGVGFRDALCEVAESLGLDGWVRNRRDGAVEALVRGDPRAADALARWCRRGPPAARVEHVDARPATESEMASMQAGFRRLPTV